MILKIILILILIICMYIFLVYYLEKFSNYTNTGTIPLEYNQIYSSIPYDIIVKNENSSYYDYGNDELNERFIKMFNINQLDLIKNVEGIEWTKWNNINDMNLSTTIYSYSKNIINDFRKKIEKLDYKFIKKNINRFKTSVKDANKFLLDIDVIIHRPNRPLARHIKIIAYTDGMTITYLFTKIIGVIKECDLTQQLSSANDVDNYVEFVNDKKIIYDMNSFIYDTNDRLVNSAIEYQLYNKLLKDLK